mgnify:FL=1
MTIIDIYFSKPPTPQQVLTKVRGMMKVSKSSTYRIILTYKNDTMELEKDPDDKSWQIKGRINGYTDDQLIADLNA